ncbi:MAG: hypothetical protein OHK0056_17550 [Bacteriovoracaceae bacterium]
MGALADEVLVDLDQAPITEDWLDAELSGADFKTVDQISEKIQKSRDARIRKLNLRPPKVSPWSPKPFQARLKTGAVITDLKTDQDYVIKKPIYVVAREQFEGGHRSFLYDKNNEIKYIVDTRFLTSVEEDLKLTPKIDPTIVYEKPDLTQAQDKKFPIESQFLISFEGLDATYWAQIFRGSQTRALGERYEVRTYFNNEWPVQFGVNGNLGRGSWNDETLGTSSWINVFIGPTMRYQFYKTDQNSSSLHLSAGRSLLFQSQKNPDRHQFSAVNYQLDLDYTIKTDFADWVFNGSYRSMRLSLKESTEYLEVDPSLREINSLTFGIGIKMDFSL